MWFNSIDQSKPIREILRRSGYFSRKIHDDVNFFKIKNSHTAKYMYNIYTINNMRNIGTWYPKENLKIKRIKGITLGNFTFKLTFIDGFQN